MEKVRGNTTDLFPLTYLILLKMKFFKDSQLTIRLR